MKLAFLQINCFVYFHLNRGGVILNWGTVFEIGGKFKVEIGEHLFKIDESFLKKIILNPQF